MIRDQRVGCAAVVCLGLLAATGQAPRVSLFRDAEAAELNAVKSNYLSGTRALLRQADGQKVGRHAPKTLAKAEALLAEAEQALNEDRYDTDRVRDLAREAQYEARHAIWLAGYLRSAEDADWTVEDVILDWESPLSRVAASLGMSAGLDQGHDAPTDRLIARIGDLQARNQRLEQDFADANRRIAGLEDEIRDLDARLGGATAEHQALMQRLAAQARVREQFAQIEQMFARREAEVFRESDNVYIRLAGLSFAVGKADIDPDSFELLTKLERAVQVFPGARLVVEGHTDSYGGDAENFELSQQRAEAVRQYLLANVRLDPALISSVGYGESRPVANNETAEGRSRNRRIDLRIEPGIDSA